MHGAKVRIQNSEFRIQKIKKLKEIEKIE